MSREPVASTISVLHVFPFQDHTPNPVPLGKFLIHPFISFILEAKLQWRLFSHQAHRWQSKCRLCFLHHLLVLSEFVVSNCTALSPRAKTSPSTTPRPSFTTLTFQQFRYHRLAPLQGPVPTVTHFTSRPYKAQAQRSSLLVMPFIGMVFSRLPLALSPSLSMALLTVP